MTWEKKEKKMKEIETVEHFAAVFLMLGNSEVVIMVWTGSDLENVYVIILTFQRVHRLQNKV